MKSRKINRLISITLLCALMVGCSSNNIQTQEPVNKVEGIQAEKPKIEEPDISKVEVMNYLNSDLIKSDVLNEENVDYKNILFKDKYNELEGVLGFRGNNYRDSASYGYSNIKDEKLSAIWDYTTSTSSWGGGAGWTGQPSIVKWPKEIREKMNIKEEFKNDDDFTEVIYASLDGNIYFLDLKSGLPSREKIRIGNPIKGSLSIDPRGLPLLYVGEGIAEKKSMEYNIYSLIDCKKLYSINGSDSQAYRRWGAFDSSTIVSKDTDTLIVGGENGLLYLVKLNSNYDKENNKISIDPKVTKYRYKINDSSRKGKLGIENSVAVYANLVYFADNAGYIHCVDLNTLKPVWSIDGRDDIDASLTLEVKDNKQYIYAGNEVDFQGTRGVAKLKKIDGISGNVIWEKEYECLSQVGEHPINGGLLSTNVIGKNEIDNMVIFSLARYKEFDKGVMVALDKSTGEEIWKKEFDNYMWSSPVDFYKKDGKAYLIQCDSLGQIHLIDPKTSETLDIITLNGNIESSPAIFNDYMVVATRNMKIYGVEIK